MKKVIICTLFISISIFLCGCTYNHQDSSVKPINQELSSIPEPSSLPTSSITAVASATSSPSSQNGDSKSTGSDVQNTFKIGDFHLGMKYADLIKLDLYNTDNEITENTEINNDKNAWDYGNKVVWTQSLCCLFDKDDAIYKITVNGDIPTSLGLKVGDTTDTVERLYGKYDYQYKYDWGKVFEYNMDNYYFDVSIQDNKVFTWGISKYKDNYNGDINDYCTYENSRYRITLRYEKEWKQNSDYINRFDGEDGFFQITAFDGDGWTIDEVTKHEDNHKLIPYGKNPVISKLSIHGLDTRLIMPSKDQVKEMNKQAEIIVKYPNAIEIDGFAYYFLILYADKEHILQIAKSIEYISN